MRELLIVMAKEPRPGFVKTRLGPDLSPEDAALLYESMLKDILAQASAELVSTYLTVAFVPLTSRPYFLGILPDRFDCMPQRGPDLSRRLANAFADAFNLGFGKVVIRNSDSPRMSLAVLRSAYDALDRADVALSPDGREGYSLVGLSRPHPRLFTEIAMSTPSVLADTLALAETEGLDVALLEPTLDLDTIDDVRAFARSLTSVSPEERQRLPSTLARLEGLGLIPPMP